MNLEGVEKTMLLTLYAKQDTQKIKIINFMILKLLK